ncbi:MAG: hypothetical protein K5985_09800 [Lachnospiraceae bacterium]|nr:hypothetical protein [Lachnospiraceae bacterium]
MEGKIRDNFIKILSGELKYTSSNLAFNMLISKLQKKIIAAPESVDSCLEEIEGFVVKYPLIAKVDFVNIAAL